jgi:hypothetical protein
MLEVKLKEHLEKQEKVTGRVEVRLIEFVQVNFGSYGGFGFDIDIFHEDENREQVSSIHESDILEPFKAHPKLSAWFDMKVDIRKVVVNSFSGGIHLMGFVVLTPK